MSGQTPQDGNAGSADITLKCKNTTLEARLDQLVEDGDRALANIIAWEAALHDTQRADTRHHKFVIQSFERNDNLEHGVNMENWKAEHMEVLEKHWETQESGGKASEAYLRGHMEKESNVPASNPLKPKPKFGPMEWLMRHGMSTDFSWGENTDWVDPAWLSTSDFPQPHQSWGPLGYSAPQGALERTRQPPSNNSGLNDNTGSGDCTTPLVKGYTPGYAQARCQGPYKAELKSGLARALNLQRQLGYNDGARSFSGAFLRSVKRHLRERHKRETRLQRQLRYDDGSRRFADAYLHNAMRDLRELFKRERETCNLLQAQDSSQPSNVDQASNLSTPPLSPQSDKFLLLNAYGFKLEMPNALILNDFEGWHGWFICVQKSFRDFGFDKSSSGQLKLTYDGHFRIVRELRKHMSPELNSWTSTESDVAALLKSAWRVLDKGKMKV